MVEEKTPQYNDLDRQGDCITLLTNTAGTAFQTKQSLSASLPKLYFIMC